MTQSPLILTQTDHRNQGTDEKKQGPQNSYKKIIICILLAISFTLINIVITGTGLVCKSTQDSCPDDWIGFQNKCYYFSKEEQDWNSSRHNCVTQHADLTMIDTDEEMGFLKRYKCTSDHWIGLEMTENQTGRWVKGTIFNKWFPVRGSEKCAYLDDNGAATARCYTERKWICRRKMY